MQDCALRNPANLPRAGATERPYLNGWTGWSDAADQRLFPGLAGPIMTVKHRTESKLVLWSRASSSAACRKRGRYRPRYAGKDAVRGSPQESTIRATTACPFRVLVRSTAASLDASAAMTRVTVTSTGLFATMGKFACSSATIPVSREALGLAIPQSLQLRAGAVIQ